jgi:hypothetical protein
MAFKIGMGSALKQRIRAQQQWPAEVAQTPLRQVTNFISDSTMHEPSKSAH